MPKQPAHRGMIYPPEAVAEAILYSAEHPKRDMFVGFQSKFFAVLGGLAPRLMDKLMEKWMFPSQQSDGRALSGWLWYAREGNPPGMDSLGQHLREGLEAPGSHNHDCRWSRRGNLVACDVRCPKLLNLRSLIIRGFITVLCCVKYKT